ncbi:class E sortase [Kitasatospora sp. NBC_01539]|uniref:class E sortase n=1 Tax=Kitasatospora sp. NBC_01539 TaxID=2903577 RepID=UPI00386016B6
MSPVASNRIRAAAGAVGELMITLGVVFALFAAYSLWWTDVVAARQASAAAGHLRQSWSATAHAAPPAALADGAVGFLHVPAMGRGQVLVRRGTGPAVLDEGVAGLYEQPYPSAMPWDAEGNVTLAAHRDGHGAAFHDLDRVGPGSAVVVETADRWYVYRVDGVLPETSPENVGVIAPVPADSPYDRPGRYITLTTCTPVYTSLYRLVVWGSLARIETVDARRTPPVELRVGR